MQSIQSYFIPAVHPKMNSGKESVANAEFGFSVEPAAAAPERRYGAPRRRVARTNRRTAPTLHVPSAVGAAYL